MLQHFGRMKIKALPDAQISSFLGGLKLWTERHKPNATTQYLSEQKLSALLGLDYLILKYQLCLTYVPTATGITKE